MVIYDEVLNILFELEKKVFNYYNVVKVGMCWVLFVNIWNIKVLFCFLLVLVFEVFWVILFNWEGYIDDCFWNVG